MQVCHAPYTPAHSRRRGPPLRNPDIRHRLTVVVTMTAAVAALYTVQQLAWPHTAPPRTPLMRDWSLGSLLWLSAAVPAAFELTGLLMFRHPRDLDTVKPVPQLVSWRIVSRGINTAALTATIAACRSEMAATPLFRFVIEVITDTSSAGLPPGGGGLSYITVPPAYRTPRGTLAKARALEYARLTSPLPARAWIAHLDEETCPTRSGIQGIARAIAEEEASGTVPRIGQGAITYHRDWAAHPFFTLSDCIRTGSDYGRSYLSMRIGVPLFGLHGSFIVVRNDVEQAAGFDVGPRGSQTEDAWWGVLQMQAGVRCRWVDGYLAEQCTQTVPDFLRQRRRWFTGLVKVAVHAPVKLRWRLMIGVSMAAWGLAPLAWVYTLAHFGIGGYTEPAVRAFANGSFAVYVTATVVGLLANLREHGVTSSARKAGWLAAWLVLMPAFSLMESAAVAFAIVRPARGFHVVKK
jgi:egghead protein (zeste-white 4 protein)